MTLETDPPPPQRELATLSPIHTHLAHWGWDEHQYFGHRVFGELLGSESLTGLTALSVLGRRLEPEALAVLDDIAVALTLADPRIWPLKLARTLSSYGGSIAGMAGSLLVQSDARIGPWTGQKSAELLTEWHSRVTTTSATLEEVVQEYLSSHRFVWGFGTPFREKDERLVAFTSRIQAGGRDALPFWKIFSSASVIVQRERGAAPNMGMGVAAALLDIGVRADQAGALSAALMSHMFLANAIEGSQLSCETLRCLPEETVQYTGRAPRLSPAASGG